MTNFKTIICVLFFLVLSFPVFHLPANHLVPAASSALAATDSQDTAVQLPATIAVLPFTIHASEDFSHIPKGVEYMLHSRLSWPEKVRVVPRQKIRAVLNQVDTTDRNRLIKQVADRTNSDLILEGSITRLAGSFSIDAMVYDMENKRYMTFFEQSADSGELISKVAQVAAGINKQVFDRSTITWEKMEQERRARINELKRRNPEHLMQNPQWQQQDDSPGWKIWKYLF